MSEGFERPEGGITAIYGPFGGGKSLFGMELVVKFYREGYRQLRTNCPVKLEALKEICPDLEVLVLPNAQIKAFWLRPDCPQGAVYLLDELHLVYDAQDWKEAKKEVPTTTEYWSQVRKSGDQVIVISQTLSGIIGFVRQRLTCVIRVFRLWDFFCRKEWVYEMGHPVLAKRGKMIRFGTLKKFMALYDTRGKIGVAAGRHGAKFVGNPNKVKQKKPWGLISVGVFFLIAGICCAVWALSPSPELEAMKKGKSLAAGSVVSSAVGVAASRPSRGFSVVLPEASPVFIKKGKYETSIPGAVVLEVTGRVVRLGLADGRMRTEERDFDGEYNYVRDQRRAGWGNTSGAYPRSVEGTRGQSGVRDQPQKVRVLGGSSESR